MSQGKSCFVIAPIGDAESEIRRRSDQVFKYIITPCAEKYGYHPQRADHISEPGIITSQVIQHIVEDNLVIADLSERNPNVFYELALRHAIRRPVIQLIKKGEVIPFDIAATRIIHFDVSNLDSVEAAKSAISEQIESVERGLTLIETPITAAVDLMALRRSDNPEQRSIAELSNAIASIRLSVERIEARLDRPLRVEEYLQPLRPARTSVSDLPREPAYRPAPLREIKHVSYTINGKDVSAFVDKTKKLVTVDYKPSSDEEANEIINSFAGRYKAYQVEIRPAPVTLHASER